MLFNDCLRCVGFRLARESVSESESGSGSGIFGRLTHTQRKKKIQDDVPIRLLWPPKTDVDLRRTLLSGLFNLFDCSFSPSCLCVSVCVCLCLGLVQTCQCLMPVFI